MRASDEDTRDMADLDATSTGGSVPSSALASTASTPAPASASEAEARVAAMRRTRPARFVRLTLLRLLLRWRSFLAAQPPTLFGAAAAAAGLPASQDQAAFDQCIDNVVPLLRLCRKARSSSSAAATESAVIAAAAASAHVPADVLERLVRIAEHIRTGAFVAANDEYFRVAIGNAPWPSGITMVGIHERAGRERISSGKIARAFSPRSVLAPLSS
jgi:hypothetical protein